MYTLRGTAKLLARLGPVTEVVREPPSTTLGDWYGTLIHAPGMQLVLLVSERTLLPVVVPAREARTLTQRFPLALARVLAALGVAPSAVERELRAMAGPGLGKTASHRVLGTMNDFKRMLPSCWPPASLTEVSLWLAESPCGPIGMRSPDDLTRELFEAPVDLA